MSYRATISITEDNKEAKVLKVVDAIKIGCGHFKISTDSLKPYSQYDIRIARLIFFVFERIEERALQVFCGVRRECIFWEVDTSINNKNWIYLKRVIRYIDFECTSNMLPKRIMINNSHIKK